MPRPLSIQMHNLLPLLVLDRLLHLLSSPKPRLSFQIITMLYECSSTLTTLIKRNHITHPHTPINRSKLIHRHNPSTLQLHPRLLLRLHLALKGPF